MRQFRNRELQLLVATDIAARGLDVDDISHIINYSLPDELEVYIHRSGRTGRAGRKGLSLSLIATSELRRIRPLEKMLRTCKRGIFLREPKLFKDRYYIDFKKLMSHMSQLLFSIN